MLYPSWRYHKTEAPKIIKSEAEEHKDWKDSPAHFEKDESKHEPQTAKDEEIVVSQEAKSLAEPKEIKPKKKK